MPEPIDAYHTWLGIPPDEQPPHAYRLLGVRAFEADLGVIRTAADRQMAHLRTYQLGECSDLSQRLLNEVAAARARLLDPTKKAEYDRRLSRQLEVAKPTPPPLPESPSADWLDELPAAPTPRASFAPRRRKPKYSWPILAGATAGVVVLILAAIGWWMLGGTADDREPQPPPDSQTFDVALAEATRLARASQYQQAIAALERFMESARGDDWKRGGVALSELKLAMSESRALEFWSRYKATELADFQEKGRLPESRWLEQWGEPIRTPAIREVWASTLERTLPEAISRAESKPEPIVIATRLINAEDWANPSRATAAEEIDSDPEAWQGKLVYVDGARLGNRVTADPEHGYLLDVTSAAGTAFPGRATGDKLLFATHADIARQLKQLLAGKGTVPVGLYCRIERDKRVAMGGLKTFPKAVVYKLELYLPQ